MRHLITAMFLLTTIGVSSDAVACGAPFGDGMEITEAQTIVVRHQAGEETYIFNPEFCGEVAEFGLILPISGPLTQNPSIEASGMATAFDELTAFSLAEG